MKVNIYNMKGERSREEIELEDYPLKKSHLDLIHQEVTSYLSNQRLGTASTKTRAEVSGGGRKPWRQKGTGRARAGSIRSPIWKGGGVTFGPKPRDYSFSLPKKMKRIARKDIFVSKIKDGNLLVIEQLRLEKPKTKEIARLLKNLKIRGKVLFLLDHSDENLKRSLRNIKDVGFLLWKDLNTYQLINNDNVIVSKKGFDSLCKNMKLLNTR